MALYHDADGWLVRVAKYDGAVRHILTTWQDDIRSVEEVTYEIRGRIPVNDSVRMYEIGRRMVDIPHSSPRPT